jgi:hypothetical protein
MYFLADLLSCWYFLFAPEIISSCRAHPAREHSAQRWASHHDHSAQQALHDHQRAASSS